MENLETNQGNDDNRNRISGYQQWTEKDMEWWNLKKEKLKNRFPFLSDEDLNYNNCSEKMMIMLLCYKLHMTKDLFEKVLSAL
jgi:hypothetical protein